MAGVVVVSLGLGYVLADLYRTGSYPDWVALITLQFLPISARAAIFLIVGLALCALGLWGLYRSTSVALAATGDRLSLVDVIYQYRLGKAGPRIVCIGGGTGMPTVLRALKDHSNNITAIVTVGDDGGSSGRLRREHGILPPGDFRNSIVALAQAEPLMAQLFQYRFGPGSSLEGHSFGNLFVLAMTGITGNFEEAIRETSRVLAVRGTILPSTLENVTIGAQFQDGTEIMGESQVPEVGKRIDHIYLQPSHPFAQPEAVKAILEADLVILGPGSLYTSVVPNLLVEGVAKALLQTDALKVYVCNVATQPGETDGYSVEDHVRALERHMPGQLNPLDVVLAHRHPDEATILDPQVRLVRPDDARAFTRPRLLLDDLVREDNPLRHDPEKLAQSLLRLFATFRPG